MNHDEFSVIKKKLPIFNPIKKMNKIGFKKRFRFLIAALKKSDIFYLLHKEKYIVYLILENGGGRFKFSSKKDLIVSPIFIDSGYRGMGLSQVLFNELDRDLDVYGVVAIKNVASLSAFKKFEFRDICFVKYSRFKVWTISEKPTDVVLLKREGRKYT